MTRLKKISKVNGYSAHFLVGRLVMHPVNYIVKNSALILIVGKLLFLTLIIRKTQVVPFREQELLLICRPSLLPRYSTLFISLFNNDYSTQECKFRIGTIMLGIDVAWT